MERLRTASRNRDGTSARAAIEALTSAFTWKPAPPPHLIDLAITNLFTSKDQDDPFTLITFIRDTFVDSTFSNSICYAFDTFDKFLINEHKIKMGPFVNDIVSVCLKILRSACVACVKEACLSTLIAIASGPWSEDVPDVLSVLTVHMQKKNEKPTVMAKEYELIGLLCRNHPEHVHDQSENIGKSILQTVEDYVEGKAKISFPLLEGCFKGIDEYLHCFQQPFDTIYKAVKMFSDPKEQNRRGYARAALNIVTHHGENFKDWLKTDRKYWHPLLLKWINKSGHDDKEAGRRALLSYYKYVGVSLSNSEHNDETSSCLEYFINYFKTTLSDKRSDADISFATLTYEMNSALKGFAIFITNCKDIFKRDEFKEISETIAHRALSLYNKDNEQLSSLSDVANEETTARIEELCNHIEALAVMKFNSDKNLEMLLFTLLSDFSKCLLHRQYIVKNALKIALPVVNVKLIVPYFINETCKHFISSSLYYTPINYHNNNVLLTYETYMPLWESIMHIDRNNSFACSEEIYDEFFNTSLKIFPKLNLTTIISKSTSEENRQDEFLFLESYETPEYPNDYKFFTNICDLISSVLQIKDTQEWFVKWIEPMLQLILNGRRRFYDAIGYLKILEIVLKLIKELECENSVHITESDELTDIGKIIVELLNELNITNANNLFQLRSALVFLQTPPQLLNNELMPSITYAFKVVFLLGKSNLNLATEALNVLNNWNSHLSNNLFQSLCHEVLPVLNEYLCSTCVSELNITGSSSSSTVSNFINPKGNTVVRSEASQLTSIQHNIMIFLGKVDSSTMQTFLLTLENKGLDISQEDKQMNIDENFKLLLPCLQQQNLSITLDNLIPRIKELALYNTHRETRITACQTIHSIILIMYGTGVTLPISQRASFASMQTELHTVLLHLAADSDEAISKMFVPLLKQTCHWLSLKAETSSFESDNFLSVLFNGCSHPTDNLIQNMSCEAIKEFIVWCIKKSSHQALQDLPQSISYILKTICRMMLHPDDNQKRGSYMAFNCAISQLYYIDSAIDKYLPELLYSVAKSIQITFDDTRLSLKCSNSQNELALKVLSRILFCLEHKSSLFMLPNETRKKPPKFGEATVSDIALWLLSQLKSPCRPLAKSCFNSFIKISSLIGNPKVFIDNLITDKGSDQVITEYFKYSNIHFNQNTSEVNLNDFTKQARVLSSTFDICIIVVRSDILALDYFLESYNMNEIFLEMKKFLQCVAENKISDLFSMLSKNTPKSNSTNNFESMRIEKHVFENSIFESIWKFFNLLFLLSEKSIDIKPIINPVNDIILYALKSWFFDPHKQEVFKRNLNQRSWDIKKFLRNIKEKLCKIWSNLEDSMIEQLNRLLLAFFQEPMKELNSDSEFLNIFDCTVSLLDVEKVAKLSSTFQKYDLTFLFDLLFVKQSNGVYLANSSLHISSTKSLCNILNILLNLSWFNRVDLINILTNDAQVISTDSEFSSKERTLTYGDVCFKKFKHQISMYVIDNSKWFFDVIKENITNEKKDSFVMVIDNILQFSYEENIQNEEFQNNLSSCLITIWPSLIQWNTSVETLINLYSLLIMILPDPRTILGSSKNNLNEWLFNSLKCNDLSVKIKTKLIVLLPTILAAGCDEYWYSQIIRDALEDFSGYFPQSCHEFKPHSKNRVEYLSAIKALLEATANSGSFILLETIIKLTAPDRHHICEEQIGHKLESFMKRLSTEEQLHILKGVYKIWNMCSDANILYNTINRFVIPLLLNSSFDTLESFFIDTISSIYEIINKPIVFDLSQYQLDRIFVEKIGACKMLEIMYIKIPFERLDSPQSKIIEKLKMPPREFTKEVFKKLFGIHKTKPTSEIVYESSKEFLRLTHCTVYKCLYAITIARPSEELKFYNFLINSKGSNWEAMIDANKKYQFPIKSKKVDKSKLHSIPTKRNNQSVNWANSLTLLQNSLRSHTETRSQSINNRSLCKREQFLKQTLTENILLFDVNNAIIGDSIVLSETNTETMGNDSDIVNFTLDLLDDDLNNHECMAMVCQLVKNLDRITMIDNTSCPEWVQCIIDVLCDKSRIKNVRLFLAQVVDNVRDVFMKYSKFMLNSILSVICDRCTSFDIRINYLDICLISTLLSWNCIPQHFTEVKNASLMIRFIIDEVNPASQDSDVYRHCLQLLQNIIKVWGPHLQAPYDSILKKIENKTETRKIGIQIIAAFLINKIAVWDSPSVFDAFKRDILDCLKLDDKVLYRSSAEVIGLSLKIISEKDPEVLTACLSNESNMDSEDDFALIYINQIRSILSNFYEARSEKFLECLYGIHKHFPEICTESLLSAIFLLMPKFPLKEKKMCLKILLGSMNVLDKNSLLKEMKFLNFINFLNNLDTRSLVLDILFKSFNHLTIIEVVSLIKDITLFCDISTDKDNQCRATLYDILIKIYNELQEKNPQNGSSCEAMEISCNTASTSKSNSSTKRRLSTTEDSKSNTLITYVNFLSNTDRRKLKCTLLRGLDDDDAQIKNKMLNYWTEHFASTKLMHERWTFVLKEFLGDEIGNDNKYLSRFTRIIFAACKQNPTFSNSTLFNFPLEECIHTEYNWNNNKQIKTFSTKPTLMEALNSQLLTSTLLRNKNSDCIDEKTLKSVDTLVNSPKRSFYEQSVKFSQNTLSTLSMSLSIKNTSFHEEQNVKDADDSLLLTLEPQLIHRRSNESISRNDSPHGIKDDIERKLRRRLIANKNQQIIKFSGIAATKKFEKEKKLTSNKPLESFKSFRDGDYPDIQINYNDILIPILELAMYDDVIAKDMFIVLLKSIKNHLMEFLRVDHSSTEYDDILKNFEYASLQSAIATLKCGIKTNLPPPFAGALLEICYICLSQSYKIDGFEHIVKNAASMCKIEWLGTLILEEKEIIKESDYMKYPSKKIKLESVNENYPTLADDIYTFKNSKQWSELQNLYDSIINPEDVKDLYVSYTEEYFKCFANLSDWEGFIRKISYQYAPDNSISGETSDDLFSFDYNKLWEKPWTKNFVLPMVFDANIHRLSSLNIIHNFPRVHKNDRKRIAEDLENFDDYINIWSGLSEKAEYLNTKLSAKVAIWKSLLKYDTNSLELMKHGLQWMKYLWIQECLLRQNKLTVSETHNINIYIIQMMAEIYEFVSLSAKCLNNSSPAIEEACEKFPKILKTWRVCVPTNEDDLIFWNLRLTCRSILTSRLQKRLKTSADSDSENDLSNVIDDLSHTQKFAELQFVDKAVKQSDFSLAEKYLSSLEHYNCLNKKDEIFLGLQFAKTIKIKFSNESNLQNRIKFALKSWEYGEKVRVTYNEEEDVHSYIGLLHNAAFLSYEIGMFANQLDESAMSKTFFNDSLTKIISTGELFDESMKNYVNNAPELKRALNKYSILYFEKSIEIAEKHTVQTENNVNSIKFLSNTYITMAKYCRKINQENDDKSLTINIVNYILKAMKNGDSEARRMFPILLFELESQTDNDSIMEAFKNGLRNIATWLFIPWVSQLLAYLPILKESLFDLALKLATEYPQCIVHQYRLSRQKWIISSTSSTQLNNIISQLDKLLLQPNIEMLVKSLGGVCDPHILFKTHLFNIKIALENNDKNHWDTAFKELFEDFFPDQSVSPNFKIRGKNFDCISGNKSCLKDAWMSCKDKKKIPLVLEKISNLIDICKQNHKPINNSKLTSIADFSPYLSSYGDDDTNLLDIFGQYGNFEMTPANLQNLVKIAKFETDVLIIGSLRRPIKINIIGSNGLKYSFLVKRGEDLRQDERIQQLFTMMNHSLDSHKMMINTYKVIPLSCDLGLIQWLNNCKTFRETIMWKQEKQEKLLRIKEKRESYIDNVPGKTLAIRYGNLAKNINTSKHHHNQILGNLSKYYLRNVLIELAATPEKFIYMRNNYEKSLAPLNVAHWILGIGDRHLSNCLLSMQTGSIIGIDFDRAFGISTQLLEVPELMPFRLTPQLLGVLKPHAIKNSLRQLMIQSLDKFKENLELLLAIMETFVHEPSLNWVKHKNRSTEESTINENSLSHWSPRDKINQCRKKLLGALPAIITLDDLKMRVENKEHIDDYCSIVKESLNEFKDLLLKPELTLTTSQQVDCLLNQATDVGILSVTYSGWEPWL